MIYHDHGEDVHDGSEEGASEGEEHEEVLFAAVEDPMSGEVQARNVTVGQQSLDEVDLRRSFQMASSPFMRGFCRGAMRLACKTVMQGRVQGNVGMETRVWKIFSPRTMLYRPPRGGLVPRQRLIERVNSSHWGSGVFSWKKV